MKPSLVATITAFLFVCIYGALHQTGNSKPLEPQHPEAIQNLPAKREPAAKPVEDPAKKAPAPASVSASEVPSLVPRRIKDLFPEIRQIDPREFLGKLAATEFPPDKGLDYMGGDDQFQTFKYQSKNDEEVEKWLWTEDGTVAVEQINYSANEKVIRRYFDHSNSMSEVSYEYGAQGGILRFRENGTVESYQTWGSTGANTLVRYDQNGGTAEIWHLNGNDWSQVF